jgi:adenosylcobinamide-GDP ribazoletransferase
MKDSRIGVMGGVAIACVLLAKYGGFCGLPSHEAAGLDRFLILLIVPAYARAAMLAGVRFLPYARPGGGTAADLFAKPLSPLDFWGVGFCVLLSLFLGWRGLLLGLVFLCVCAGLIVFYRRRIGGITGDLLGAMCEITEALLLICAAARF